ncbi:MAG: outer membrane protein transport protein [Hyphomicrobiaceae bacterium]|nr:outer membrane protein transport protein [Hyphomicrobiaceae bacterium]
MIALKHTRAGIFAAALCGLSMFASGAQAGGFGVREQSTTYLGSAFAGSAAGGDISSMYWNPAAAAAQPGCNGASSYSLIIGRGGETAKSGLFATGALSPKSTDVGTEVLVPAMYLTCQFSQSLFVGLALNSPFGLLTKPEDNAWAGSPIAITSKVFSADLSPTIAYKLTPTLTVGAGLQAEYFRIRLTHGAFPPLGPSASGSREYEAEDVGWGGTAGLLWQPLPGTSVGVGYRSAVGVDVGGRFRRNAGLQSGPAVSTHAEAGLTLPEEVTFSFRQAVAPDWAVLGTVEWTNWSRLGDVVAQGAGCGPTGVCEVLNLNYRDGWFYSLGAEYAYTPGLILRAGVAYETSPITDRTRDILVPDSNRVFLNAGASYKYSEHIVVDFGYSHIFFEDAPFCIANAAVNGASTHCRSSTPANAVLLRGDADSAADIVSLGFHYRF